MCTPSLSSQTIAEMNKLHFLLISLSVAARCVRVYHITSRFLLLFSSPLECSVEAVVTCWRRTWWPWQEMLEQREGWVVVLLHFFSDPLMLGTTFLTPLHLPFSIPTRSASILHLSSCFDMRDVI